MNSTNKILMIIIACVFLILGAFFYKHINTPVKTKITNVAHAGGGYNALTYTDSINALNHNVDKYELFEMDLIFTSDDHLVCLHDWDDSVMRTFGKVFDVKIPTLQQFNAMVAGNEKYKNCTFEELVLWLNTNKDKKIVTDIKEPNNLRGLTYIANNYPDYAGRIIPQIYQPEQYDIVKNLGYKDIIWTLYMYSGNNEKVLDELKNMSLFALTIPTTRVKADFFKKLDMMGVSTYVHTINEKEQFEEYKKMGIDGIYTDWLVDE